MVFSPFLFDGLSVNQQKERDAELRAEKAKQGLFEQERKRLAKGKRAEASGLTSENRFSARVSGAQNEGEEKKKEEEKKPLTKAPPPRIGAAARDRLLSPAHAGLKPTDGARDEKCEPNSRFMRSTDRFPGADNWGTLIPLTLSH